MESRVPHATDETPIVDLSCRSLKELPPSLRGAQRPSACATRELNLAFNKLSSLLGVVEACPALERLVACHNHLRSLPNFGSLHSLCRVDLSHNRLADVSALSSCTALAELWLASNALELPALLPLGTLGNLRDLVLHGNPCLQTNPSGLAKRATLLLLPSLASLDAQPVAASARAEAATFMQAAGSRAALQHILGPKGALALLRSGPARYAASGCGGGGRGGAAGGATGGFAPRRRRLQGGGGGSSIGGDSTRSCASCCSGFNGSLTRDGSCGVLRDISDGQGPAAVRYGATESEYIGDDAESVVHAGSTFSGTQSNFGGGGSFRGSSTGSPQRSRAAGRNSGRGGTQPAPVDEAARDAAMSKAHGKLADSERALAAARENAPEPATSGREHTGYGQKGSRARFGRRSLGGSTREATEAAAPPSVPASDSEMVLEYPKNRELACVLRADGSCVVRWPGGALAVAVEAAAGSPMGFSLHASYPGKGKIAAAFDSKGGGFAYSPDGKLLLSAQPNKGGSLLDASGATLRSWGASSGGGGGGEGGEGKVDLKANGGEGATRICVALGDCMALVFAPPTAASPLPDVSIAFRCDGFRHLVSQAANPQQASWDAALDSMPAVTSLRATNKPRRRVLAGGSARRPGSASLPSALAQAGGPRAGIGGIQDALALLPDLGLKAPRTVAR